MYDNGQRWQLQRDCVRPGPHYSGIRPEKYCLVVLRPIKVNILLQFAYEKIYFLV